MKAVCVNVLDTYIDMQCRPKFWNKTNNHWLNKVKSNSSELVFKIYRLFHYGVSLTIFINRTTYVGCTFMDKLNQSVS